MANPSPDNHIPKKDRQFFGNVIIENIASDAILLSHHTKYMYLIIVNNFKTLKISIKCYVLFSNIKNYGHLSV